MKFGFYSKLALDGIRKNKRMYVPYLLTCIGMVVMYYILLFLQTSEVIGAIGGGDTLQYMLAYGIWVLAAFSCIFLFYTNSFLMRRRKKEFGLYNILGMGKRHIAILICWETVLLFVIAMVFGLLGGIVLSKLAELGVLAMLHAETTFHLTVSLPSILQTLSVFTVIFALLLLNSLRQVYFSSTISLLKSETTGEKPPKANWFLSLLGVVILAGAYYIAVKLDNPVSAIIWFFVAVLMVIVATYLIMISGSVLLCKILQRKKGYYYKARHFISVSSMTYRMKRNGAGLASICILATMVLVMVSSTFALYVGMEDSLNQRYPRELNMCVHLMQPQDFSSDNIGKLRQNVTSLTAQHEATMQHVADYRSATIGGLVLNGKVEVDSTRASLSLDHTYSNIYQIFFVPLSDYNAMTGTHHSLGPEEALLYTNRQKVNLEQISFNRGKTFTIKESLDECFTTGDMAMTILPSMILVVQDVPAAVADLVDAQGNPLYSFRWDFAFDTDLHGEKEAALFHDLQDMFRQQMTENKSFTSAYCESRSLERTNFLGMYGGLFYLGILLSIVFLFAAALIIYYKQISEGYEDQARFQIMQKVGLTKQEIRKSINSQLLTVFFLPLLGAGLHICFAFPIIEKLLMMFNMQNRNLFILTTAGSFLLVAVLYVVTYKITSNAYYRIVSDARPHASC